MPTTRQKFLQALGITSASLAVLRPTGAPEVTASLPLPVPPPSDSRLRAPTSGVYVITGQVEWALAPPSVHTLALLLRGEPIAKSIEATWAGSPREQTVSTIMSLKDEDVEALELVAYDGSGAHVLSAPAMNTVRVA